MAFLTESAIRSRDDLARFEAEMPLEQRLPERSVLDVFIAGSARQPEVHLVERRQPRPVEHGIEGGHDDVAVVEGLIEKSHSVPRLLRPAAWSRSG